MTLRIAARVIILASLVLSLVSPLRAESDDAPDAVEAKAPATASPPAAPIAVAILDFEAADPSNKDLGKQIAETLNAILTGEPGFILVDRGNLSKTLQEQELSLSGIVSADQASQIGKLVGAKILIVGKAFSLGQKMFVTAKLIGTETSLVEAVLVKSKLGADMADMVIDLSEKVSEKLRESGPKLIAANDSAMDALPALKAKLANRVKPRVAVIIPEGHLAARQQATLDPAVETEIKILLQEAGFIVQDAKENALADWARTYDLSKGEPWPRSLTEVDVVIVGEGFSEFLTRIGNLVSCAARAEVNMIDRSTGRILLSQRTSTRAVDLAENVAGKKALENAGRSIGLDVLRYFDRTLPEKKAE